MRHTPGPMALGLALIAAFGSCILFLEISDADSGTVQAAPGETVGNSITLVAEASATGINITLSPLTASMALDPNSTRSTLQGTMTVRGSGQWKVEVSATPSDGYPAEFDLIANQYVSSGYKLLNPMHIQAQKNDTGEWEPEIDLSTGGDLISDGTGERGYNIYLYQTASPEDIVLQEGHIYRITLTFVGIPLS
jgi:hypothetical protein